MGESGGDGWLREVVGLAGARVEPANKLTVVRPGDGACCPSQHGE